MNVYLHLNYHQQMIFSFQTEFAAASRTTFGVCHFLVVSKRYGYASSCSILLNDRVAADIDMPN